MDQNYSPTKLTPQFLLKKVKRSLGAKSIKLSYSDDELMDIFYEDTLPTFSIFFPAKLPYKVDLTECEQCPEFTNSELQRAYHLPILDSSTQSINVIDIESIEFYNNIYGNYWSPPLGVLDSYDIFTSQIMQGTMESMMSVPITYRIIEPDILLIDEPAYMASKIVVLDLLVSHARDLSTVKYTYLDKLMTLFKYDCQIALYEDMQHNDGIDTTFNQVDLKIEKWSDAQSNRESLLEKWSEQFLSHRSRTIYRI